MTRAGLASVLVFIGLSLANASPAAAQQDPQSNPGIPGNDDKRFTFHRVGDGYLRLDGRTGQVSQCSERAAGWQCQLVPDERTALEAEISRVQAENAALKAELLSRNLPLPGSIKPSPPEAKGSESGIQLPSDADLNRVMTYFEKIWKRVVDMIASTQKEIAK